MRMCRALSTSEAYDLYFPVSVLVSVSVPVPAKIYLPRGGEIVGAGGLSPPPPPPILSHAHTTQLQQHSSVTILGVCRVLK